MPIPKKQIKLPRKVLKIVCGFVGSVSFACTIAGFVALIALALFKPDSISGPTKFERTDLVKPREFIADLKQSRDSLPAYLRSRFSQNFQTLLNQYDTSTQPDGNLKGKCLDEINRIIEGPNIYDPQRFAWVALQERTFKLMQQNPKGRLAVMLNRWLIEDAYYDLLKGTSGGLWEIMDKLNAVFGVMYTFVLSILAGMSWALWKVSDHFDSAEETISELVEKNSQQLVNARAFGTISDLYPPLALSTSLQKLFREHLGGVATRDAAELHISASNGLCHVTIQSEALYYSLLCSFCRAFADDIGEAWRSHVLLPNGVAVLFVPEMIQLLQGRTQSRFYFFRNNFLDYDRSLMAGAHARKDTLHLLPAFAKASRILFRDHGANYGARP